MYKWNTEYRIIDDFLEAEDFERCKSFFKSANAVYDKIPLTPETDWHIHKNSVEVNEHGKILSCKIEDPYMLSLFVKYNDKLLEVMDELAPERKKEYKQSTIEFVCSRTGLEWAVHRDIPEKLLSAVIYVSPEQSTGTILCKDKEGSDPYEVEWKENRCFIFCQSDDSYHWYENFNEETRNTITWNLRSTYDENYGDDE